MRWTVATLVLIAGWIALVLYTIRSLPAQNTKSLGGCLLAIGALNILFGKATGQKFFDKTQSSSFGAAFWAGIGEKGIQLFFLGLGIILAIAGCILLATGTA